MRRLFVTLSILAMLTFSNNACAEIDNFKEIVWFMMHYPIATNTDKIITLKGIGFQGYIKEELVRLCEELNPTDKFTSNICELTPSGKMFLNDFKYGNTPRFGTRADAYISADGMLYAYEQTSFVKQIVILAELLTEKYGKPTIFKDDKNSNYKTTNVIMFWKDTKGTVIELKTFSESIRQNDFGRICIMSSIFINKITTFLEESARAEEKRKKEALKSL